MAASSSAESGKCLGSADSGRVGTVVKDDSSSLPFKVECNGNDNWYTQEQLVLASAVTDSVKALQVGQRVQMAIGDETAVWKDCPGSRLSFNPGYQVTIREIRNGFFRSTEYETLWAPLSAARADEPAPATASTVFLLSGLR